MSAHTGRQPEVLHRWSPQSAGFVNQAASLPNSPEGRSFQMGGFVKGPLPLPWMQQAAALPGKTLHVALCLWYLAGLTRSTTVRLSNTVARNMGVSRDAKSDALRRLAEAGLVQIQQNPGQAPLVTIVTK